MKQIFEALEKDARLTPEQISTMTGISVAEVKKAIKKAEEDRAVLKYKAVIYPNVDEGVFVFPQSVPNGFIEGKAGVAVFDEFARINLQEHLTIDYRVMVQGIERQSKIFFTLAF